MGNSCGREGTTSFEHSDFCPLRIATLYADIDESINKKKKIDTMIEYFMKPYHGYHIDVMCIQGIRNPRILKEIVGSFKKHIEQYNDEHRTGYGKSIYLEYYPDVDNSGKHENDIFWSTSESEDEIEYYDKLIISRHNILQSADIQIGSDKKNELTFDQKSDAHLMINNTDSDEVSNMYKYVQMVNLNVDGTFVSLYNVDLEDDTIGISNTKERKKQIQELKDIIDGNRQRSIPEEVRQFVHGDNTFVACNRDLHIVTGIFHVNEVKNGVLSSEYNKLCNTLNALDVHRWIASLRHDGDYYPTNVRFTKDTYTFLVSKQVTSYPEMNTKSQKLFEEHKTVVINSYIARNIVDMNRFTNYPEDTIFMLYRPNIELLDKNRMFSQGKRKKLKKHQTQNTTRFIDLTSSIVTNNTSAKPHPKYGQSVSRTNKTKLVGSANRRISLHRHIKKTASMNQLGDSTITKQTPQTDNLNTTSNIKTEVKPTDNKPDLSVKKITTVAKNIDLDIEMTDLKRHENTSASESDDSDDDAVREIGAIVEKQQKHK